MSAACLAGYGFTRYGKSLYAVCDLRRGHQGGHRHGRLQWADSSVGASPDDPEFVVPFVPAGSTGSPT